MVEAGMGRVGIRTWRGAPLLLFTLTSMASWFRPPNRHRFMQLGSQREFAKAWPYRSWNCGREERIPKKHTIIFRRIERNCTYERRFTCCSRTLLQTMVGCIGRHLLMTHAYTMDRCIDFLLAELIMQPRPYRYSGRHRLSAFKSVNRLITIYIRQPALIKHRAL